MDWKLIKATLDANVFVILTSLLLIGSLGVATRGAIGFINSITVYNNYNIHWSLGALALVNIVVWLYLVCRRAPGFFF